MSHIGTAKTRLVDSMLDMVELLPLPIVGALVYIQKILPEGVRPLANSVVVQVLMATIYSSISTLIPHLKQNRTQKEKVDFLLAFCESLCNESADVKLTVLEAALEKRLNADESENPVDTGTDTINSHVLEEKFDIAAFSILQDNSAKIPFMALHR